MGSDPGYRRLFRQTLAAVFLCAALVLLCYLFVDRPVALLVHDRGLPGYPLLRWLTYPPPVLQAWTPVALAALMVRRVYGPLRRWERAVAAACVGAVEERKGSPADLATRRPGERFSLLPTM